MKCCRNRSGFWLLIALLSWVCLAPRVDAQGKKWALVVGIDLYENEEVARLRYAAADAKAIALALRQNAGFEPAVVMTGDLERNDPNYPTSANVIHRLKSLITRAGPDDTLLLYLAGHAFPDAEKRYYFGTVNADPDPDALKVTTLPLAVLHELLETVAAGQVICIVDACRCAPEAKRGDGDDPRTPDLARALLVSPRPDRAPATPRATAFLFSCRVGESAKESNAFRHGVFTHFLLDGLHGKAATQDGRLTLAALDKYVEDQMREWGIEHNASQLPDLQTQGGAEILVTERVEAGAAEPKEAGAPAPNTNGPADAPGADDPLPTTHVSLSIESGDLYGTLKLLCQQTRMKFTLDPSLKGVPVTISAPDIPFNTALDLCIQASGLDITYTYRNGVLSVFRRK